MVKQGRVRDGVCFVHQIKVITRLTSIKTKYLSYLCIFLSQIIHKLCITFDEREIKKFDFYHLRS